MKIAYLSTFYPYRGGISQFNASLFKAFEKDNEVKAYTFKRQYPNILFPGKSQYVQNGDDTLYIESERVLDSVNPITYQRTANRIRKWNPDILIMKYWMSFFGPSLGWVAKQMPKSTKVVTVLDNVIPHEKRIIDKPFTSFFLNQNDGFVVMSESVERDLLSMCPKANYIHHMHPIYDHFGEKTSIISTRLKLNIPLDKKVLLFFGFIRDYKGLDILIDSFSKLSEDYYLVIAGEPYGSFDKYRELINQLPNKGNVKLFIEYISDDFVSQLFSASDVCVLPYKSATQSGITYISYHFGLPVIATDVGGLRETIKHKETGFIVEKPDSCLLFEAIKDFFETRENIPYIENIAQLKNELSWDHLAKTIIDFVNTL